MFPLYVLYFLALFYSLAARSLRPVVALYASSLGLPEALIGLVVSSYAVVPILAAIPLGSLLNAWGCRRAMLVGATGMMAAGLVYALTPPLPLLVLVQAVSGTCELLTWVALQTLVSEWGPEHARARTVGYFSLFSSAGEAFGPFVGGLLISWGGFSLAFEGYGLMATLAFLAALAAPRDAPASQGRPAHEATPWAQAWDVLRNPYIQLSLLTSFIILFVNDICSTFYPIFLQNERKMSVALIGTLLSTRGLAQVVVRPLVGYMVERWGLLRTMLASTLLGIVGITATPLLHSIYLLAAFMFITGLGTGLNMPLSVLMIAHHTEYRDRGVGMSLRLIVNRAAHLVNPVLFGVISQFFSLAAGFYVVGAFMLAGMAAAAWRIQRMQERAAEVH